MKTALSCVTAAIKQETLENMFKPEFLSWFGKSCIALPNGTPLPVFRLEQAAYQDSTRLQLVCYVPHPGGLKAFERGVGIKAPEANHRAGSGRREHPYYSRLSDNRVAKFIGVEDREYLKRVSKVHADYVKSGVVREGMHHLITDVPPDTISTALVFLNPKRILRIPENLAIVRPMPAALPGLYDAIKDKYDGVIYSCAMSGMIIAVPPGHTYPMFKALKSASAFREHMQYTSEYDT